MGDRHREIGAMMFAIRYVLLCTGGRHAEKEINMCKHRGEICVIYDIYVIAYVPPTKASD